MVQIFKPNTRSILPLGCCVGGDRRHPVCSFIHPMATQPHRTCLRTLQENSTTAVTSE